jgi:hypothetical protein
MSTETQACSCREARQHIAKALIDFAETGVLSRFRSAIGDAYDCGEQEFFAFCVRYLGIQS